MTFTDYNDPKKSLVLFGLQNKFDFFYNLFKQEKLPHVLMLTGKKGVGKFTLINHLLTYIFDSNHYDLKNYKINDKSYFYKQYINNSFSNTIILSGNNFKTVSIEGIRALKSKILKTTISGKKRFIIFDDVDLFNKNSLNALLKIIEEPSNNNYFILINNNTNKILETVQSRALEVKFILNENMRVQIIKSLIETYNIEVLIDFYSSKITPGNFLIFNSICKENQIQIDGNFMDNFTILLDLYKKNKSLDFINLILFLTDMYFFNQKKIKEFNIAKIISNKNFIVENLNNFILYNLNQNTLINAINEKINNG